MLQTARMAATIGPNDVNLYESPLPQLLRETSGIQPVNAGTHVMLKGYRVRSIRRLAIGDVGGRVTVSVWPAELKEQAKYLYGQRLGRAMIATARERGWTAKPNPHLAFRNSAAARCLYMEPQLDAAEYARRWEEGDLERVGAHQRADIRADLLPWLKSRGYATDDDDPVLEEWIATCLGNRPTFLRPGLRLSRAWRTDALASPLEPSALADEVRSDVDAILRAAGEPPLPATRALLAQENIPDREGHIQLDYLDILGDSYPEEVRSKADRRRWNMAVALVAGGMFPATDSFPPSLVWPGALALYRAAEYEMGSMHLIDRDLIDQAIADIRAAGGGLVEYLHAGNEAPGAGR
jgi:hypothetical protein